MNELVSWASRGIVSHWLFLEQTHTLDRSLQNLFLERFGPGHKLRCYNTRMRQRRFWQLESLGLIDRLTRIP